MKSNYLPFLLLPILLLGSMVACRSSPGSHDQAGDENSRASKQPQPYKPASAPAGMRFTKEHIWIRVENQTATIGISDYAQSQLGEMIYVELPKVGESVDHRGTLFTVEGTKTVLDLNSPLSGTITQVNTALEANPEYVNSDPYGKGWIVGMSIRESSEVKSLLSASEYELLMRELTK